MTYTMLNTEMGDITETGHIIGAMYESDYWGYEYVVLGETFGDFESERIDVVVMKKKGDDWDSAEVESHHTPVGDDEIVKPGLVHPRKFAPEGAIL